MPADADRHEGFTEALKDNPDIKVVASVFTGWSPDKAAQQMKELLASGKQIDGVWTSGTDKNVIDAYKAANLKYVPVVGADNNGFMGQEIEMKDAGVVGINVTNPPAVGGAGLSVALDILAGKTHPQSDPSCAGSLRQLNSGGAGVAQGALRSEGGPNLAAYSPVKPYTHYAVAQEKDCKGPGE